jgi:hypothetical protein
VLGEVLVGGSLEAVIIGVLGHAAVKEGPGQEINGILLVSDGLGDNLGVKVIMEEEIKVRFHGEGLIQELLVEILRRRKKVEEKKVRRESIKQEGRKEKQTFLEEGQKT